MSITPAGARGEFRQCQASGCLHRAEYAAKLCVPPKGYPIEANKHLSMIVGLPLCEDHIVELDVEQILNDHIRKAVDAFCVGKVAPDYQRAFLLPVALDSPEYRRWLSQHTKGKTQ